MSQCTTKKSYFPVVTCTALSLKSRPRQQQCRSNIVECYESNDSFDKVETNRTCSIICFDFVERTKFHEKLVRHCCRLTQQSRILLRHSLTLLRHCCWCGRGLTTVRIVRCPRTVYAQVRVPHFIGFGACSKIEDRGRKIPPPRSFDPSVRYVA